MIDRNLIRPRTRRRRTGPLAAGEAPAWGRQIACLAACVGLSLGAAAADPRDRPAPPATPNVLFIVADDLGVGDLACFGNPHVDTPVLDGLARDGVLLRQHYAPSPLCAPTRGSLLTGRYVHRTGAIDVSSNRGIDRIKLSERTFGDYFQAAGYRTGLIGKWHNGLYNADYLPHRRGFDSFVGFANGVQDYWAWNLQRNDGLEPHDGRYLTDVLTSEAVSFIRTSHEGARPWALFLAHHTPHVPLQAPAGLIDKYEARLRDAGRRYGSGAATVYAMIEQMDTGVGEVLGVLDELGVAENTIVVFTSDNGADLRGPLRRWDAGLSGNKGNVMEQGIRIPAIAAWPGTLPAGVTLVEPTIGLDWLPTLFGLTGVDPPPGALPMDGVDILPLLRGAQPDASAPRALPFQKNRYTPVRHSDAALRRGPWKLLWPGIPATMKKDIGRDNPSYERGRFERPWEMPIDGDLPDYAGVEPDRPKLFHVETDPGESEDLAGSHPGIVKEMAAVYDAWFDDVSEDWRAAHAEIRAHDAAYWRDREAPDPRELFKEYWQWDRTPGTDRETDDPLETFRGFWSDPPQEEASDTPDAPEPRGGGRESQGDRRISPSSSSSSG